MRGSWTFFSPASCGILLTFMDATRIRSRILVVALLLFVTGSALAWDRTYRRAVAPDRPLPSDDRYMAIEHGGQIVPFESRQELPPAPVHQGRVNPAPVSPEPPPTPARSTRKVTVRDSDTLSELAERELGRSSRWREVADLNDLTPPYVIHPGQTLHVPSR